MEHDGERLPCGEPARAKHRRDQHTDSHSFNDTHHDSEIVSRPRAKPAELDCPKIVFALLVVVIIKSVERSASSSAKPSGRVGNGIWCVGET